MIRKTPVPSETTPRALEDTERHRVLVAWNQTARDYPRDKCIHELFEQQVLATPDAVALVHGGGNITYRALNAAR